MIRFGSDFSGVGAANQALMRLGVSYDEIFACDIDKYARKVFVHNYGKPKYFPKDVYERKIPDEPLDLYVTSPPCQSFSLAGHRAGENDERGVLFYNSHEFIRTNRPRFFVFENVKGLLSVDNGEVFGRWIDFLGGKSVNRVATMFPHEKSVPYHIYWQVLNARDHNVPQNRERIFVVGIRDDQDNCFSFPRPEKLKKKLKDVLEKEVDERYYLSKTRIKRLQENQGKRAVPFISNKEPYLNAVISGYYKNPTDRQYIRDDKGGVQRVRRPTPRECFRLMDFPDSFDFSIVSNTQAYRQAGNSVVVKMYELLFGELLDVEV